MRSEMKGRIKTIDLRMSFLFVVMTNLSNRRSPVMIMNHHSHHVTCFRLFYTVDVRSAGQLMSEIIRRPTIESGLASSSMMLISGANVANEGSSATHS
jgi:hypothetical protein